MNQAQKTCQINTIIETETENEQQAAASMQYIAFSIQLKYIRVSRISESHTYLVPWSVCVSQIWSIYNSFGRMKLISSCFVDLGLSVKP